MRVLDLPGTRSLKARTAAFTLAEVVVCVFIMMLLFAGIITGYIQTSYRAEWSGYSLAAQALAAQQLEHAKAAVWDTQQTPVNDEIRYMATNPPIRALLDLPVSGTNYVYATIYTTPTLIVNGVYSNYMVKVDAVWPFRWKNQVVTFTNTVACYYAPD
jgi:general stress protein CsbA